MPALLAAGLAAWIDEQAPTGEVYKQDPPPSGKPPLHARLIEVLDEATENEAHWAFRAIAQPNAIARHRPGQGRLHDGRAGPRVPQRRLFLLRNGPWPTGTATTTGGHGVRRGGRRVRRPLRRDLRVFAALRVMRPNRPRHLQEWLVPPPGQPTPTCSTRCLGRRTAGPAPPGRGTGPAAPATHTAPAGAPRSRQRGARALPRRCSTADEDGRGHRPRDGIDGARPSRLDLESLRRHTAIFAGSGSGKTVLIRRLVEECALHGVSAIVLDPNNDLARLGDAVAGAAGRLGAGRRRQGAGTTSTHTDVVVWTPRVERRAAAAASSRCRTSRAMRDDRRRVRRGDRRRRRRARPAGQDRRRTAKGAPGPGRAAPRRCGTTRQRGAARAARLHRRCSPSCRTG